MEGGGSKGMGEEIRMGETKEEATILPLQVFQEVKKSLVLSKQKINELCTILRKNRIRIEPRIREKLVEIDLLLDSEYETVKVTFMRSVTVEEAIDPTVVRRGRKSTKLTRKVSREIEEKRDITLLKNIESFLDKVMEERGIWPSDAIARISMDIGDNSLKVIANVFSKHQV